MRKTIRSPLRKESPGVKNYLHLRQTSLLGKQLSSYQCQYVHSSLTRKRAKTEDEKEQRRIERVLRNRQAAQSSRERKRQEVEKLEGEKFAIEQQNQLLKERLLAVEHEKFKLAQQVAKMAAEMSVFKSQNGSRGSIAHTVTASCAPSPSVDLLHQQAIKQELDDYPFALPTPQPSVDTSTSSFSTPSSSTYSRSPSPSRLGLDLDALATSLDLTQHPAAMLCGLQCQSEEVSLASTLPMSLDKARRIQQVISFHLCLTLISAIYLHLLHPLSQIFISLRTGSPLPSKITPKTTPMLFLLIRWLILTPANLTPTIFARPTPSTIMNVTTKTIKLSTNHLTSLRPSAVRPPIFRLRLLRRLLLCSPALARPLKGATDRAMRPKTSRALNGLSNGASKGSGCSAVGDSGWISPSEIGPFDGVALTRVIDLIEQESWRFGHLARLERQLCTTRMKRREGKTDGVQGVD